MYPILGQLFAVLTAACWAQNSLTYSAVGKRVGSPTVTHIRLWLALPMIILVHLIFTGTLLPTGLPSGAYIFLSASGFVGFCLADLLIFRAFVEIGARETMVIMTMSPIFSALLSWLILGEILMPLQILGILGTIGGVSWVIIAESRRSRRDRTDSERNAKGIAFAVAGALTQAGGMILARQGLDFDVHPVSANVVRISAGLVGLTAYALLRGQFVTDFRKMSDRRSLLLLTLAAFVGPVLGIILTLYALSWAPVGIVTALMQITPIMLIPIDRFYYKKHIPLGAVAGTFVALGGAALLFVV
jgi:drug/metabolite transporter (DMT)-like permease